VAEEVILNILVEMTLGDIIELTLLQHISLHRPSEEWRLGQSELNKLRDRSKNQMLPYL
jgi:hypothetical protein